MITYNNKDILKSFIGNNRIVKKYLNNKIVYGIPDFAQYYLIDHKDNYNIVGDTIIQNNIANNFSAGENGNHLIINNFSNIWTFSTLELNVKFRFTNVDDLGVGTDHLLGTSILTPFNRLGMSASKTSNSKINIMSMVYLVNPDTGNYFSVSGNQFPYLDENTWYILNLITNGTDIELSLLSEDGTLLRKQSTPFGTPTNKCYSFNTIGNTNVDINGVDWAGYFHGDIDLSETYIKVNDRYMFNGNQNYKELLWCNPNVYLQSNGKAYINTGVPSNAVTNYKIDYMITDSSIRIMATGADVSFRNKSDTFIGIANSGLYWYYGTGNSAYHVLLSKSSEYYFQKNRLEVNYSSTSATASIYNNIEQISSYTTTASELSNNNYYLFGINRNGTATLDGSLRIYSAQYYGNNINKHLVPVPQGLQIGSYKVPSNGMFDIVTQTFYENKGSREFIWGVDL